MNDSIEIRHMRYFLAVAETLHFGRAAKKLGIAQPPLSQQIKNLERILGYSLFDRTTRGVRLTRVGESFQQRCRSTVEKMQNDLEAVRRLGGGQEGALTVGFSQSAMFTAVPKAIERYRRLYPKIELRLRELVTAEQIPLLLNGTLDLGLLRDGEATDQLQMESILREPFIAVLSKRHKLAGGTSIRLGDLKREPFVLFSPSVGNLAFARIMACCEAEGFRPQIVQEAPEWPTLVRLVAAGLGVTLAPACVANVGMPGVVHKKVRSRHWSSLDIAMRTNLGNPAAEGFLRVVRLHFSNKKKPAA
jgi:DNA-binding transcriptional LysR family regulator